MGQVVRYDFNVKKVCVQGSHCRLVLSLVMPEGVIPFLPSWLTPQIKRCGSEHSCLLCVGEWKVQKEGVGTQIGSSYGSPQSQDTVALQSPCHQENWVSTQGEVLSCPTQGSREASSLLPKGPNCDQRSPLGSRGSDHSNIGGTSQMALLPSVSSLSRCY